MMPVTPWLPRMFWMLALDRNAVPLLEATENTTHSTMSRMIRPPRSSTSGMRTRAVGAERWRLGGVTVSVAIGTCSILCVAQLGQSMRGQLFARYLGDDAAVAEHDRPIDDVRQLLEVRGHDQGRGPV